MPVQFIGSGGGSSTTDARTIFADPVHADCLAGTTTPIVRYTIPANYLLNNDSITLKVITQNLGGSSGTLNYNLYIGTTGTTSDTLLNVAPAVSQNTVTNSQHYLNATVCFPTTGSSGTCFGSYYLVLYGTTTDSYTRNVNANGINAINTTVQLYLTLIASSSTVAAIDTLGSYITIGA